jgi:acetylglutamate kinase
MTTVLKLGGELLDDAAAIRLAGAGIVRLAARGPVVVVHGGGRAIDAELRARGETPRFVDGLRVTDEAALGAVIAVLAGRTNTSLVAAVGTAGGRAIGLTGADGLIGLATRTEPLPTVSGERVDLGLVGQPDGSDASLLTELLRIGCIPIIASIGFSRDGALLNVNADTLAAHFAAIIPANRLIIAGATPGVLDGDNNVIPALSLDDVERMVASGEAHSGMVAKLAACRAALDRGVRAVAIVDGRSADFDDAMGTVIRKEMVTT